MIMLGNHILSPNDPLEKITEESFYQSIKDPVPGIEARVRQLRIIYQTDQKRYLEQLRTLPYITCGIFSPQFRNSDNFGYIESFIISIKHIPDKDNNLHLLRANIEADERVMICFSTPNEDGLKVMFRLSERCYEKSLFSIFYKEFARKIAIRYQLETPVDMRYSNVTQACFISHDKRAYFNPNCELIAMSEYMDMSSTMNMLRTKKDQEMEEKEETKRIREEEKAHHNPDPDKEIMERIKQQLHLKARPGKPRPHAYVPQILNDMMDGLCHYIEDTGLQVAEIIDIQYGKKLRIKMGSKEAEVNLFHGRKGFSVVKSPRSGTNAELNELCVLMVQNYIYINM